MWVKYNNMLINFSLHVTPNLYFIVKAIMTIATALKDFFWGFFKRMCCLFFEDAIALVKKTIKILKKKFYLLSICLVNTQQ